MKTICFLTVATALGLSLSLPAQQPGPDQDRPKDPPPANRPDPKPDVQPRESGRGPDHGPGPQARSPQPDQGPRPSHHDSAPGGDREEHLRQALRHLRAAGLGDMADRLEHFIKDRGHDRRGPQGDIAHGHGRHMNPQQGGDARAPQPQRRPQWSEETRRDGGAFAAPQRVPDFRHRSDPRREGSAAGTEELRAQVQRLANEVEQLKNLMKQRLADPPREQVRRPEEPRREERRDSPPGPPREERRVE